MYGVSQCHEEKFDTFNGVFFEGCHILMWPLQLAGIESSPMGIWVSPPNVFQAHNALMCSTKPLAEYSREFI